MESPGDLEEKEALHNTCALGCHSFQQIFKNRYDERSWGVLVSRMLHRGGGPLINDPLEPVSESAMATDRLLTKWLAKVRGPDSVDAACKKIDKERADPCYCQKSVGSRKNACVDDIIKLLDQISFKSELMMGATESLREGLKKFSTTGAYANYFYGENTVDFTNDLVVIETEELKSMADLQTVILQIFVLTISNQIFMGNRARRCLICIDEARDLLKSPQMQGFIQSLAPALSGNTMELFLSAHKESEISTNLQELKPYLEIPIISSSWVTTPN